MIESVISSLSSGVLGAMFQNRSRLDELRCEHLALQIRQMQGGAGPVIDAPLGDLVPEDERQDWIVLGERGSGKTALGVTLAQLVAGDQEIYALGFRKWASDQLGIQTVTKGKLKDLRDCVLLVDETALHWSPTKLGDGMISLLAVARHRNVSVIWTAQNSSQIDVRVLRHDFRLACKKLSVLQTRFDREEIGPVLLQAVGIQTQYASVFENPEALLVFDGQWFVSRNGLPEGWSEKVSTLWR